MVDALGEPVLIRYEGLDADSHEIEIAAFADSLKGLSRIIGVAGNFAATQKFVQHKDALSVRVVAQPATSMGQTTGSPASPICHPVVLGNG